MNFEEKLIERLKRIEREVERLRVWERPAGGSGVTDHGALTGLSDNDHPQYLLTTGKAADSDKLDGLDSTAFAAAGHDHDTKYLLTTGKAADSDKLDNIDSTGFVQTSGNQTVGGIKTFTSIPALPATNPTTANQAVRKGFADATYLGISAKAADSDKLDGKDSTAFELASVWQSWTPDCNGWSSYAVRKGRYRIQGETLFFLVEVRGVSNSTTATVDLPSGIVSSNQLGTAVYAFAGIGVDNGVPLANPMRGNIGNNTSTIVLYKDFAGAKWTASGNKQVIFSGWCEIQ